MSKQLIATAVLLVLGACQSLPIDGPLASDVRDEVRQPQRLPFRLIELRPDMVPILDERGTQADGFIVDLGPSRPRIGPGDGLVVTIVEPSRASLFSAMPTTKSLADSGPDGGTVTLSNITVDPEGRISIPLAGRISVTGLTPAEAADRIRGALAGQMINPQVTVRSDRTVASTITVAGAVRSPGTLPLLAGGETLLQAIARAGAPTEAPENVVVQLTRFGNVHRMRMQTLLERPEFNIHVRAGDDVTLLVEGRKYLVLGATEKVEERTLGLTNLPLAAALAESGGLIDSRADARSVMLFRYEPPSVLHRIEAVDARLARARGEDAPIKPDPQPHAGDEAPVPVVFMINMRSATGLFMAQQLQVHEDDMIYAPNSTYAQWQKFLDLVRLTINPFTTRGMPS